MLKPCVDDGHGLLEIFDGDLHKIFNKNFSKLLSDLQIPVWRVKQILNLLLVDLEEGKMHLPIKQARVGAGLLFEKSEYEIERWWDDALALKVYLI